LKKNKQNKQIALIVALAINLIIAHKLFNKPIVKKTIREIRAMELLFNGKF